MKIAIAGKNLIAINSILFVLDNGFNKDDILICVNKTDLGEDTWQPSLKKFALQNHLKVVSLTDLYEIEDLLFISLEFDKIIKPELFKSKKLFNIHFSFLPEYKGMYTSCIPLLNGEMYSGVTLHCIDKGIDTGDIIDQFKFDIPLNFKALDLYENYLKYGVILFERNFLRLINNNYTFTPQASLNSSYYPKSSIDFSNIIINFNQTAYQIYNQIRAFLFRPYQLPKIDGQPISHSSMRGEKSGMKPGTLVQTTVHSHIYSSIDYNIEIFFDRIDEILNAAADNAISDIQSFFDLGYDLNIKNTLGWNPLIVATYNESIETVDYLLNKGCDINSINYKGTSVLMYALDNASKKGDFSLVEYLISKGANPYHRDFKGISVLDYCVLKGNPLIIKKMKQIIN